MRQKFFAKTIQSDFIKSLIYNTPLPVCDCVLIGDYLVRGCTYVYDRQLIRCTANGYLRPELRTLQITPANLMGMFILGFSTLGFRDPLTKVTFGSNIFKGKYYLLGQYDLRYELQDGDPDYPRFSSRQAYLLGDIVIHVHQGREYLYVAIKDISPGIWNDNDWQYIESTKEPYDLIECKYSGIIGELPVGAQYEIIQEFEPQIYSYVIDEESSSTADNAYLSGKTYYIIAEGRQSASTRNWEYKLVYNDYAGWLSDEIAQYEVISSYIPEKYYTLYTQRYLSAYDYYDSGTHKELGRYLRFYRSVYQVNLMPFYNCWDGSYLDGFTITDTGLKETRSTTNKLIKIPVKFNKTYTIALDCSSEVKIIPALIKLNDRLIVKLGIGNDIDLCDVLFRQHGVNQYNYLNFNKPITYSVQNKSSDPLTSIEGSVTNSDATVSEFLQRYENDLYLLIQVPSTNNSSIVILEGDYTSINTRNVFSMDYFGSLSLQQINQYLLTDLSLLRLNDRSSYPFADRLIEYLVENVITNRDEIGEDILRVRQKLGDQVVYDGNIKAWDEYLRKTIYDLYTRSSKTSKIDITGYVDKDVEQFISLL